jgi:hypothetical protein
LFVVTPPTVLLPFVSPLISIETTVFAGITKEDPKLKVPVEVLAIFLFVVIGAPLA